MTISLAATPRFSPFAGFFRREPLFASAALGFILLMGPLLVAAALDDRLLLGAPVWIKPLKFAFSLAVYFATLAWFAGWLPEGLAARRWYRWFARIVVLGAVYEIAWITIAAALGTQSHFNDATPVARVGYGLAGVFVIGLISAAPVYAWHIRRDRRLNPVFRLSVVLGLWLSFGLTMIVAQYMAAQTGHAVGGDGLDADGMALIGWARDGGDLRVAHFFALHAMHFIPVFGLAATLLSEARGRLAVLGFSALFSLFTLWTFAEALAGRPFLPGL